MKTQLRKKHEKPQSRTKAEKTVSRDIEKTAYSSDELLEFKNIILQKLEAADRELCYLQAQLDHSGDNTGEDTEFPYKEAEDGQLVIAKEEISSLAFRQKKFREQLQKALFRIENRTYGKCVITGKLIPKERLRIVPHTTHSIEAKNKYAEMLR
jgi:DnaK suppressor protein